MTDLEAVPPALHSGVPIIEGYSEEYIRVIRAALDLTQIIHDISSTVTTPADELPAMPNRPSYWGRDTQVVVTQLRGIGSVMHEVTLDPPTRPVLYHSTVSLQATPEGVRLHKESLPRVYMGYAQDGEIDSAVPLNTISGPRALRMQEILLQRAARQLRERNT